MADEERPGGAAAPKQSPPADANLTNLRDQTKRLARSLGAVAESQYTAWKTERYSDAQVRILEAQQREIDAEAEAMRHDVERRTALMKTKVHSLKAQGELQFWHAVADSDSLADIRGIVEESRELLALLGIAAPPPTYQHVPGSIYTVNPRRNRQIIESIVSWSGEHCIFDPDQIRNHWRSVLRERMDDQSAEEIIQSAIELSCDPNDYQ